LLIPEVIATDLIPLDFRCSTWSFINETKGEIFFFECFYSHNCKSSSVSLISPEVLQSETYEFSLYVA